MRIKLWRICLLLAVAAIFGVSVYNWNAKSILGNQLPMPFGWGAAVVLSGSMEPELSAGDLVIVRKTDEIDENDIIVFQKDDILIIHRVIRINSDEVITKGDMNNMPDEAVSWSEIKGKMVMSIPFAGHVVQLLWEPEVTLILLVAAVVLSELSYRKEQENDDDELDAIRQEIKELVKEIKEKQ